MDNDDTLDTLDPMDDSDTWAFIALITRYERDMAAMDAADDL